MPGAHAAARDHTTAPGQAGVLGDALQAAAAAKPLALVIDDCHLADSPVPAHIVSTCTS